MTAPRARRSRSRARTLPFQRPDDPIEAFLAALKGGHWPRSRYDAVHVAIARALDELLARCALLLFAGGKVS